MNTNLLDLNNDILNIIGDYVKKDNYKREIEVIKDVFKQTLFEYLDMKMKAERKEHKKNYGTYQIDKYNTRYLIWTNFNNFYTAHYGPDYYNKNYVELNLIYFEYLKSKNLYIKNINKNIP